MVLLGFQSLPLSLIAVQIHLFYIFLYVFLSQPVRLFIPAIFCEILQAGFWIIERVPEQSFVPEGRLQFSDQFTVIFQPQLIQVELARPAILQVQRADVGCRFCLYKVPKHRDLRIADRHFFWRWILWTS